jgi:hypothetical protein
MFAAAFVAEISSYTEARVSQHHSRIVEEMHHVSHSQETSTSLTIPSARALFSHNISHLILSPRIANAIMGIASNQHRRESLPRSRTSAHGFWRRARNLFRLNRGNTQALGAESGQFDTRTDMRDVALVTYLDEFGKAGSSLGNSTLTTAIYLASEGLRN